MKFINLEGITLKNNILNCIRKEVICNKYKIQLVTLQVGNDPASTTYIKNKLKACEKSGIKSKHIKFNSDVSEIDVINTINNLNIDSSVNGIMVQLPIPVSLNRNKIINTISPIKDVDGITSTNLGKLIQGEDCFLPCTPSGIIKLLAHHNVSIKAGMKVTIIGASIIVGLPLSIMLKNIGLTVTTCDIFTSNISSHIKYADIVVCAIGKTSIIKTDWMNNSQCIIDIGINRVNNKLTGDIDYNKAKSIVKAMTPTPGGAGPVTVACLIENTFKAYLKQMNIIK